MASLSAQLWVLLLVQAQLWVWELEIVLLSDLKAEQISAKRPASLLTLPSAKRTSLRRLSKPLR